MRGSHTTEADKQAKVIIRGNPALRKSNIIRYEGELYEITFIGKRRGKWIANLLPAQRGKERKGIDLANLKNVVRAYVGDSGN